MATLSVIAPDRSKVVYWRRELPPLDAEAIGEHTLEATSTRVPYAYGQEHVWERCYEDLMAQARARLEQEVIRLGGDLAHVLEESIEDRHDAATGTTWLHGRFQYVLYRCGKAKVIEGGASV
jgi:hypothetical protein